MARVKAAAAEAARMRAPIDEHAAVLWALRAALLTGDAGPSRRRPRDARGVAASGGDRRHRARPARAWLYHRRAQHDHRRVKRARKRTKTRCA